MIFACGPLLNINLMRLHLRNHWMTFARILTTDRFQSTGLFEIIVGVLTTCHLVLQMQPHAISFYGVTSRIRFMFLLFPQISRNWRYESEPPLKPTQLTCGTNSIIVFMFAESQTVHIQSTCKVCNKNLECFSIRLKKKHIHLSQVYCVWQVVKTPTIISNNPVV